jgi:hypothetical protein
MRHTVIKVLNDRQYAAGSDDGRAHPVNQTRRIESPFRRCASIPVRAALQTTGTSFLAGIYETIP